LGFRIIYDAKKAPDRTVPRGKKEAFAGGLDYILNDESSAFGIGVRTLKAAVKSFDRRGRKTIFEKNGNQKSWD